MRPVLALVLAMAVAEVLVATPGRCELGAEVFHARCAKCHGETGKTEPAIARALKVRPLANDPALARLTPAEIVGLIKSDPKHRGVVDLKDVTDADVEAAAFYVRELARKP